MQVVRVCRPFLPLILLTAVLPAAGAGGTGPSGGKAVQFLDVNGATAVNLAFSNGKTILTYTNVAAGDYHLSINGGPATTAFCTDLWDEVYIPETWSATEHATSAPEGLAAAAAYYQVAPFNINAIDYIGQHYTAASSSEQAAAQLAVWDLVVGGRVSKSGSGYAWSDKFTETGIPVADVFAVEQAGLSARGAQGSRWLQAVSGSQTPGYSRPQDFVTSNLVTTDGTPSPAVAPEPSSVAAFGFLGLGLAALLIRARRRMASLLV